MRSYLDAKTEAEQQNHRGLHPLNQMVRDTGQHCVTVVQLLQDDRRHHVAWQ